ncbi:MAG: glutamate-cysteine ligase family protein [Candidatus Sumerlaeia bacterium]
MTPRGLHLFQGYGVELEYMIVDRATLDVTPVADKLLHAAAGDYSGEAEIGETVWSNELVLHVVELKTNGPAGALAGLPGLFAADVATINELLETFGARLMPTAMHPWMNPLAEARIWPHDNSPIYRAYDRIFDCRGHGWSNLQSMHLNLPFHGDDEFARLHAAIRLVLPILPALAASSPIVEGRPAEELDHRLEVYRSNQKKVPMLTGRVIPEPVFTRQAYQRELLGLLYRDIAPHDPDQILRHEWLNSRGAIARFARDTIEIRVIDVQECPAADLAIAALVVRTVKSLVAETWADLAAQEAWPIAPLEEIFLSAIMNADATVIRNRKYLEMFGFEDGEATAGELWSHLLEHAREQNEDPPELLNPIDTILNEGPLARRILKALGPNFSRDGIQATYAQLCDCLAENKMFGRSGL